MQIFCSSKDTIKKIEKQVMYWKKIFPKYISVEAASWSLSEHNIVNKLQHAHPRTDLEKMPAGSWQWTLSTTGVSRCAFPGMHPGCYQNVGSELPVDASSYGRKHAWRAL